jgi:hypothetical protein
MPSSSRSVFLFAFYLYGVALGLIVQPTLLLGIFGIAVPDDDIYIRITGVVVGAIAFYYHRMGLADNRAFARLTVFARAWVFTAFLIIVLLGKVEPGLVLIGGVDLLGAGWTWWELRKEGAA